MQKHLKSLNDRSIVLCFVSLFVLDIHVFGEMQWRQNSKTRCVLFWDQKLEYSRFWDPKFENSRFGALNIKPPLPNNPTC